MPVIAAELPSEKNARHRTMLTQGRAALFERRRKPSERRSRCGELTLGLSKNLTIRAKCRSAAPRKNSSYFNEIMLLTNNDSGMVRFLHRFVLHNRKANFLVA